MSHPWQRCFTHPSSSGTALPHSWPAQLAGTATHTSAPCPGRFFGTKWAMFLAVGIYALFVSSNYWERYYTLVPSAVAIGMVIVPLWASMGTYITR